MDKKETNLIKITNFIFKRFDFKRKKRFAFFGLISVILGLAIVGSVIAGIIINTSEPSVSVGSLNQKLVGHWPLRSDSEKVGSEMVTNGGFDADANWTKSSGWSIGGGVATHTGVNSTLYQDIGLVAGKNYRLQYSATITSGGVRAGGNILWIEGAQNTTSGTYTTYFTHSSSNNSIIYFSSDGELTMDNVTVKEIHTADSTPNSNYGTIYGADVRNHGASFDGDDDYLTVTPFTETFGDSFTISAWLKFDEYAYMQLLHTDAFNFKWRISESYPYWNLYDEAGGHIGSIAYSSIPNLNEWHYYTFTYDGAYRKIYLDGVFDKQTVTTGNVRQSSYFKITVSAGELTNGNIADVLIYDRALSDSEILDLYQGKEVSGSILDMPLSDKTGFKDVSGNDNHGTNSGATIIGESADFDGTDDYINTTGVSILSTDDFTFAGWAYIANLADAFKPMMSDDDGQSKYTIYPTHGGKPLWYHHWNTDPYYKTLYGTNWTATGWHNVAVSRSGTTYKIYQDGVETNSSSWDSNFNLNHLYIGRAGPSRFYNSNLSDIRVYKRALSEPEIKSLYAKGRSGSSVGMTTGSFNKGLVGHWDLSQESEKAGTSFFTGDSFDFEGGIGNWVGYGGTPSAETTTTYGSSAGSMKITFAASEWGAKSQQITLVANRRYRSTAMVYIPSSWTGTNARIEINHGSSFSDSDPQSYIRHSETKDQWEKITNTFTTRTDVVGNMYLRTSDGAPDSGDYLFVDELSIKELRTEDSTPSANVGSLYQDSTIYDTDRHGQSNKVMSFDGVDEYIDMGDPSEIDFSTNDWTISAWVKQESVDKGVNQGIVSKYINGWTLMLDNGAPRIYIYDGSSNRSVTGTNAADGTWHHIVATTDFDGATTLYVDGASKGTSSTSLNTLANNNTWKIGQRNGGTTYFKGKIADVRIYNRVLSKQEIIQLYESYN